LRAIGLDELVTHSLEDYEALALRLARHPDRLAGIKRKLAVNRETQALFDIDQFRRDIEAAYSTMIDIWRSGERPRAFRV
jgi:predicted O-linked N-acetylglucosamine transferase (SPINDLY family)